MKLLLGFVLENYHNEIKKNVQRKTVKDKKNLRSEENMFWKTILY